MRVGNKPHQGAERSRVPKVLGFPSDTSMPLGITVCNRVWSRQPIKVRLFNMFRRLDLVFKLSDEYWNKFCKWRGFEGFSRSNLRQLERKTGAMVDTTNYLDQTISISGDQGAVKKLVATLRLIFRENSGT